MDERQIEELTRLGKAAAMKGDIETAKKWEAAVAACKQAMDAETDAFYAKVGGDRNCETEANWRATKANIECMKAVAAAKKQTSGKGCLVPVMFFALFIGCGVVLTLAIFQHKIVP